MDRRTLLKLLGGVAALPALGKLIKGKTGIKSIKAAGKVLPKVQGMPEWFTPLVNKIMKEGVDVSPQAGRVEDMTTVKKLEIPSETGKPEVITLTENKVTGNITIESSSGGVADSPFELSYTPPKTDINIQTGEPVKYPGDFSVIENRPKPDYNNIGKIEFDYDNFDIDSAYSDLERLEKIGTGKIKNTKKIEQRAKGREMINQSPYEDIMDRFPGPPEPDDFADGGLASFANGGLLKPGKVISKISPETPMEEPLPSGLAIKSIRPTQQEIDNFVNQPIPIGQMIPVNEFLPGEDYQTYVRRKRAETGPPLFEAIRDPNIIPLNAPGIAPIFETTPQVNVSSNPIARALEMAGFTREEIMRIISERGYADGGLTKTVPPAMGPDSQGVETLFRRRYS